MEKIKCDLCGYELSSNQIARHKISCNGLGPRRTRQKFGSGKNWLGGKTYKEIFGEVKANEIGDKISIKLTGKSLGKSLDPIKEENRKLKIARSMKGNKNGATSFRRRNILYKGLHFKSGWEIKVAKYLDENNIKWEYETISYSLSETRSYTPDFSIYENGDLKHIEVKGYFRKENRIKFDEFTEMYPKINVEIWDKKVLQSKSII